MALKLLIRNFSAIFLMYLQGQNNEYSRNVNIFVMFVLLITNNLFFIFTISYEKITIGIAITIGLYISACSKASNSSSTPTPTPTPATNNYNLSAKIDGKTVKETIHLYINGANASCTVDNDTKRDTSIYVILQGPFKEGVTYNDYKKSIYMSENKNGQNNLYFQTFSDTFNTITITKYDSIAKIIGGSFKRHVEYTSSSPVKSHTITDGSFLVNYTGK